MSVRKSLMSRGKAGTPSRWTKRLPGARTNKARSLRVEPLEVRRLLATTVEVDFLTAPFTRESGTEARFEVTLDPAPTGTDSIEFKVYSFDEHEGTASPSVLVFDSTSPATQTVTVTGVDDELEDGSVDYVVFLDPPHDSDIEPAGRLAGECRR